MKQKVKDLILLLKRDRRAQVIAVVCGLAVAYLVAAPQPHRSTARRAAPPTTAVPPSLASSREHAGDIVNRFESDLKNVTLKTDQNAVAIKSIERKIDENTERTAEIFKKILERVAESEANTVAAAGSVSRAALRPGVPGESIEGGLPGEAEVEGLTESDELQPFGLEEASIVPPAPPPPQRKAVIGTGDSIRVKLLAGVNAPTDGSPYPIVLKAVSEVYGPDGSSLPLGEARIVGAAQGSLADQRVLVRATSLNLRLPDGRRKIVDIDGWIVGEDGVRGLQGILIDPIGKAIGAAGVAGGLSGLGEGFAASHLEQTRDQSGNLTSIVSDNAGAYALGRGLSGMAREWSSIIQDRVDQLVPHVQVLSGREATIVFARSVTIPDLYDSLQTEDSPYASLD